MPRLRFTLLAGLSLIAFCVLLAFRVGAVGPVGPAQTGKWSLEVWRGGLAVDDLQSRQANVASALAAVGVAGGERERCLAWSADLEAARNRRIMMARAELGPVFAAGRQGYLTLPELLAGIRRYAVHLRTSAEGEAIALAQVRSVEAGVHCDRASAVYVAAATRPKTFHLSLTPLLCLAAIPPLSWIAAVARRRPWSRTAGGRTPGLETST